MYEVITLHNPYEGKTKEDIKTAFESNKYPQIRSEEVEGYYDKELLKVVNKMLSVWNFYYLILYFIYFYNSH
jgi:hypothetical protein